jgi:transposase
MTRRYGREFRDEAVRLVIETESSIPQIARDLGVSVWTLRDWVRRAKEKTGTRPAARPESVEEENRRLRRENAVLRQEREILKKAAAYFAKEQL